MDEARAAEMGATLKARMGQVKLLAVTAGPQFADALQAVETSQTGSVVIVKATLSREVAEKLLKSMSLAE